MSQVITRSTVALSPNLVGDLSTLCDRLNGFLDLADGGQSDDPTELARRYQALKNVWCSVVGLYGADLSG